MHDAAVNGIRGALSYLRSARDRVQPSSRTSYFGFSFGGIITANLANRYRSLRLPEPKAIFLDDPHDGGLNGFGRARAGRLAGGDPVDGEAPMPHGRRRASSPSRARADGSCNAVFPKLAHIPTKEQGPRADPRPTRTANRPLSSAHGVCTAQQGTADAYDWKFCWKVWDALRSCAYAGRACRYALGDTPQHRSIGSWSDGVPITRLKIQDVAPIAP